MRVSFSTSAWDDYVAFQKVDRAAVQRVNTIIRDIQRTPFQGIGKPEPLRHALAGWWSRRVTDEHRLVYRIVDDVILIAQVRYHY